MALTVDVEGSLSLVDVNAGPKLNGYRRSNVEHPQPRSLRLE
jgi:hypothetical protein